MVRGYCLSALLRVVPCGTHARSFFQFWKSVPRVWGACSLVRIIENPSLTPHVTHRPRAALRSTIFYRKQDRLRLARLLLQQRTQTQDGADLLLQSGMPFHRGIFSLVLDDHCGHGTLSLTPQTIYDDRRVLNLFQEQCDSCKEASYDRGRRR